MTGSYSVVLGDIAAAAAVFDRESGVFRSLMPQEGPACPDGGGASVDQTLQVAVQAVGLLHEQLATAMQEHSAKLKAAHDNYARTETTVQQMLQGLQRQARL